MTLDEAVAFELDAFARYNRTQPYGREGYAAFCEQRTPSWKLA
jgi:enoyl-CoA hydratase/carnithine racemase